MGDPVVATLDCRLMIARRRGTHARARA
eukprot:SAG31_NODE_21074_length_558_cov_1.117647_1_plen_27_part_10